MSQNVAILLADDDKDDIVLMRRAFQKAGISNPLFVVQNGQEAVDYLTGEGPYAQRDAHPMPGLMLLDLKMPWMDGFDVLVWLREHPEFNRLPVVVMTSSTLQSDVDRSRELGTYDFRVKPRDFPDLVRLVDDLCQCWLAR